MGKFLTEVDGWIIACILGVALLAAWGAGWRWGVRLAAAKSEAVHGGNEAILALLGLLLGFTFSISLNKHDQRRLMVVQDSNSIGDFYTCASLLDEPVRSKLQAVIRGYVKQWLELARGDLDAATLQAKLAEIQTTHGQMQTLVGEALRAGTPIATPLVNTLNEVTSSHAARLAAVRDRLPPSIVGLLVLASLLALALVGRQQGLAGKRDLVATVGFVVLVSLVVWVTLDLNQPYRGAITVSQEPLQRLLGEMGK